MKFKVCHTCHKEKPLISFSKNKSKSDGLQNECRDCTKIYLNNYYLLNKEIINKKNEEYGQQNREHLILKKKEYYQNNKEEIKLKRKIYLKNRYKTDSFFRLISSLRNRLCQAVRGNKKSQSTLDFLGCTSEFLKNHLESQFKEGMSWENYGFYGWHIDHILPCALFDLSDPIQQKECFHYSNLQPLWAEENLKKSDKILKF